MHYSPVRHCQTAEDGKQKYRLQKTEHSKFSVLSAICLPSSVFCHPTVRLACLRHTASVHPEPGSNSQKNCEAIFEARQQALFKPCTNSTRRLEVSCGGQKNTSSIYKIPTTFWLSKFCRTLIRHRPLHKACTNSTEKPSAKVRRVKEKKFSHLHLPN